VVDTLYSKTLNLQLNRAQGARRRKRGKKEAADRNISATSSTKFFPNSTSGQTQTPAEVGLQLKTRISRLKWRNSNLRRKIERDCKFENT